MKQPAIRYLDDAPKDDWWVLCEPIFFDFGGKIGAVNANYVSDGCSVPKFLWWLFPPMGRFFVPGLIHDYCYETKGIRIIQEPDSIMLSRYHADRLFLELLNEYSPKTKIRNYIRYLAVRCFGERAWRNAKYIDISNYKD